MELCSTPGICVRIYFYGALACFPRKTYRSYKRTRTSVEEAPGPDICYTKKQLYLRPAVQQEYWCMWRGAKAGQIYTGRQQYRCRRRSARLYIHHLPKHRAYPYNNYPLTHATPQATGRGRCILRNLPAQRERELNSHKGNSSNEMTTSTALPTPATR